MKANVTYTMNWIQLTNASWCPRGAFGFLSHSFSNVTNNQSISNPTAYLVVIGGYGGWPESTIEYDGYHGWGDVWITIDGIEWICTTSSALFGPRAWFGTAVLFQQNPQIIGTLSYKIPSRVYLLGGGDLGSHTTSNKKFFSVNGQTDAYWSSDMTNWFQVNYEEGGTVLKPKKASGTPIYATRFIPQYSSQEWCKTTADSQTVYTGAWGMTVVSFNFTSQTEVLIFYNY
jgi:hypothetical protein